MSRFILILPLKWTFSICFMWTTTFYFHLDKRSTMSKMLLMLHWWYFRCRNRFSGTNKSLEIRNIIIYICKVWQKFFYMVEKKFNLCHFIGTWSMLSNQCRRERLSLSPPRSPYLFCSSIYLRPPLMTKFHVKVIIDSEESTCYLILLIFFIIAPCRYT